ncbi:hypothetical protein ACA910_010339 [Epithemia clementina (nom. ined.)]
MTHNDDDCRYSNSNNNNNAAIIMTRIKTTTNFNSTKNNNDAGSPPHPYYYCRTLIQYSAASSTTSASSSSSSTSSSASSNSTTPPCSPPPPPSDLTSSHTTTTTIATTTVDQDKVVVVDIDDQEEDQDDRHGGERGEDLIWSFSSSSCQSSSQEVLLPPPPEGYEEEEGDGGQLPHEPMNWNPQQQQQDEYNNEEMEQFQTLQQQQDFHQEMEQFQIFLEPQQHSTTSTVATAATTTTMDPSHFSYRSIELRDRDPIQKLHENWFPVTYQSEFYDDLARGHLAGSPLFTCLAIYNKQQRPENDSQQQSFDQFLDCQTGNGDYPCYNDNDNDNDNNRNLIGDYQMNPNSPDQDLLCASIAMDEEMGVLGEENDHHYLSNADEVNEPLPLMDYNYDHCTVDPLPINYHQNDMEDGDYVNVIYDSLDSNNNSMDGDSTPRTNENSGSDFCENEIIAGCVVGSFMPVSRLPTPLQEALIANPLRHPKIFYIMTVGTASEFRMAGLGTFLVQQCIHQVEMNPACGALYLHVITHNVGAIRLYEKLGFVQVQEIPDYYDIAGEKYPCYLYAKFFHGNHNSRGALSYAAVYSYKVMAKYLWSFVRQVLQLAQIPPPTFALGPDDRV